MGKAHTCLGLKGSPPASRPTLKDDEKIPISQEQFDKLLAPGFRQYSLKSEYLQHLFRVSTDKHTSEAYNRFSHTLRSETPQTDIDTEDLFHSTWDDNISRIFEFILVKSTWGRNSNRGTSTLLKRPDYSLIYNNCCLLRGEEKGSDSTGDPQKELFEKMPEWDYDPLPFVFGLL